MNDIRVFISNQLNHRMSVIESMKIRELLHISSIDIEILQRNSIEQQEKIGDHCINRLTTTTNRYDSAVSNRIGISSSSNSESYEVDESKDGDSEIIGAVTTTITKTITTPDIPLRRHGWALNGKCKSGWGFLISLWVNSTPPVCL